MNNKLSIVISCIDCRFWPEATKLFVEKFGSFDLIQLAGASKNIASPLHGADKHAILENIRIAIDLHHAETLILTNHQDCGAYGSSKNFISHQAEINFHNRELDKARKIVKKIFPKLKVETLFLAKSTNGKIKLK